MKLSTLITLFFLLLFPDQLTAQHTWQKPKPLKPKQEITKIIGDISQIQPSRPLQILWVWGYDSGHKPGSHDYLRVRDLMTRLLEKVPGVKVESVFHFPTQKQFDQADLVVLYLHLPQLTDGQYTMFESFIEEGGGVVSIHETAIIRPASEGKKLVECLGMSWDEGRSQWGAIFEEITIDNNHEIFRGFKNKLSIVDEFYWDLNQKEGIDVLGVLRVGPPAHSEGPLPEHQLSKDTWPIFWTMEMGEGRVFGTTTGHNTFSYYDPEFRIILFRAMAWAIHEKADPFMPLVFDGIVQEGNLVGTTDLMSDWEGKLRKPPE